MGRLEHVEAVEALQQMNVKLESENENLKREIDKLKMLGANPESLLDSTGGCSTDTEKQLEKVQVENVRLLQQIVGFKHMDYRRSSIGLPSENELITGLQEDNNTLSLALSTLQKTLKQKEKDLQEVEVRSRYEKHSLSTQNNKLSRQIRELQAEVVLMQAKEPEVMHRIERVKVEVESEELKNDITVFKHESARKDEQLDQLRQEKAALESKIELFIAEKMDLQQSFLEEIEALEHSRESAVDDMRRQKEAEMTHLQTSHSQMCRSVVTLKTQFDELKTSYVHLVKQVKQFPNVISKTINILRSEAVQAIEGVTQHNKELVKKYLREMHLRKKYHNELVELKGNIRVFCRVRPWIKEDGVSQQTEMTISFDPDDDGLIYVTNKGRIQTFEVDRVFTSKSTQIEVFDEVKALVTSCIDGFNVCIFAYGQTGSGKTYTMEGPPGDAGINQRAIQELFKEISERGSDWDYSISVSVLEIYNEAIRDLLSEDSTYKLEVKLNPEGGYHVPGLVCVQVNSVEDVNKVFSVGQQNRVTATTNMNEHSSRSHALLCITVTGINKTTNTKSIGKLNLVDLAGSERVSKSGADGTRLKEAQSINKSLSCLGDVIHALRCRQNHIPYRNSKLTFLLQDSLGGDSKTLMIVQVAPVAVNVGETVCSLAFAQRVRTIELGAATRRIENGDLNEVNRFKGRKM
ncbi:kinesin-like protein KIFC3 isoform X2 [Gigantopelta aegis]|uniref:kinesin-like protein KIFC3 isoform X2 n=1 Tax=Gigantopelta aegis TaxID=1735272 RepID=UPI001B888665|nr:kinesin-like protein KIFC3 isoform X2 [Gigantopelta aegis]